LGNPGGYLRQHIFDNAFYIEDDTNFSLNPISMTFKIGPAAPAPLVGGGLLSALAALLGLGMTRLGQRKTVLA